jgi:hypothetical protein
MTAPRPRSRQPKQLGAGTFQAEITSFRLRLAAQDKSATTIRTYIEAVQWFAAYLLEQANRDSWRQVNGQDRGDASAGQRRRARRRCQPASVTASVSPGAGGARCGEEFQRQHPGPAEIRAGHEGWLAARLPGSRRHPRQYACMTLPASSRRRPDAGSVGAITQHD